MHQTWDIIRDVVITLGFATILGVIAQMLRLSPIIGYLVAGLIIGGPGSLRIIDDVPTVEHIAELGVAMLLFSIGLDFSVNKLRRFGRVAIVGGTLQVAITTAVTAGVLLITGSSFALALVIGMIVSLSSTAVVIRVLVDNGQIDSVFGRSAVGVLLMQDVIVIPFLLLIPDLAGSINIADVVTTFAVSLSKIAALVGVMYVLDYLVVARAFDRVGHVAEREELLVLMTVVIALGAAWATNQMGLSAPLGAFLAGILIAGTSYADHVRAEIGPVRVVLVTLFFASIGMLADITYAGHNALYVIGLVVVVIVGKLVITSGALRIAGIPGIMAVLGGLALAQMGEFSFVLASAANTARIITPDQFKLIISVSIVTLLVTPGMLSVANRLAARGSHPDAVELERRVTSEAHHVVVGYGPAGKCVVDTLLDRGMNVTVIELNPHLATDIEARVIHGDAGKMQILRLANLATALSVTITIPDPSRAQGIARSVRALAPDARIIVRARYHFSLPSLRETGADAIIDEENEAGKRLASVTLNEVEVFPDV